MWTTNTTLADIAERLRPARRVVVLTHLKPDGDAVGSTISLVRALNRTGGWQSASAPKAQAWYYGPQPPWLNDIVGQTPHAIVSKTNPPSQIAGGEPDAIVILDTGSWTQLEPVSEFLASRRDKTIVVDHHAQGDPDTSALRYVDVKSAAVCEPAAELCRLVLGVPRLADLGKDIATPLYLGLATDTGWFRHSNVTAAVLHTAAELIAAGADHLRLYELLEQNTLARLKLIARAIESIELFCDGRLAVMTIAHTDFKACGATPGDTGGITDYTQSLPSVQVSALLSEAHPSDFGLPSDGRPLTKISLRSKSFEPAIDVNAVAKELGGGGHTRAAGARLEASLEETKAVIARLVEAQYRG
ncbi:MAG: DHH family phosphoesterase [Planctomycetes bacterium]|nr:DHH family phosphoesterase [Planctomycetota bacterium]